MSGASKAAAVLATWFGAGLLPKAPGTWGSLAAIPFALALTWVGGPWLLLAAASAVFFAGVWAGGRYAKERGLEDPGAVVIDEVAGQWIALIPALLDPVLVVLAFLAFRLFDILKPWPVGWLDRELKGGLGIMSDDVLAGVPEEYADIREQSHVFTDRARNVQMDFLARLDSIGEDCRILAGHPALKPLLELTGYRVNVSDTDRDLSLPAAKKSKLEAFLAADCELYQAVLDGQYRTPPDPEASGPACTLALDERDRIEDALSRMTLAAGLGRLPEAALWAARVPRSFTLDANSRSVMADIRARGYAFEQPAGPPAQSTPPQRSRLRFWRKPADRAG